VSLCHQLAGQPQQALVAGPARGVRTVAGAADEAQQLRSVRRQQRQGGGGGGACAQQGVRAGAAAELGAAGLGEVLQQRGEQVQRALAERLPGGRGGGRAGQGPAGGAARAGRWAGGLRGPGCAAAARRCGAGLGAEVEGRGAGARGGRASSHTHPESACSSSPQRRSACAGLPSSLSQAPGSCASAPLSTASTSCTSAPAPSCKPSTQRGLSPLGSRLAPSGTGRLRPGTTGRPHNQATPLCHSPSCTSRAGTWRRAASPPPTGLRRAGTSCQGGGGVLILRVAVPVAPVQIWAPSAIAIARTDCRALVGLEEPHVVGEQRQLVGRHCRQPGQALRPVFFYRVHRVHCRG
jgi:hypothetical protein